MKKLKWSSNPAPFAGFFPLPGAVLVCGSPERLVSIHAGGQVHTRPIAGTRRRGTPDEDLIFAEELNRDPKEQAEHGMLVDLARNDLGRVCKVGSVHVANLLSVVPYRYVMHLESDVVGEVRPGVRPMDVLGALFPGGAITGVPKRRTMEIIAELEPHPRGLYTGSLGYIGFAGEMDWNILIRSIVLKDGKAWVSVGGGITHRSMPAAEYKETLNKARPQLLSLGVVAGTR
jgi:anthranilate/para-aminobenzoate synthase component I